MKKLLLLFLVSLVSLVAAMPGQPAFAAVPAVPEGFVILEVTGTDVNIRPIPHTSLPPVAQANEGNLFIAEQWPVENTTTNSQWYRIAFALKEDGSMVPFSAMHEGKEISVFPFIHASFASISAVTPEEYARAIAIPYRKGYKNALGTSLPDVVAKFGPGEIKRTFNVEENEYFGLGSILGANVALPGLNGLLFEYLDAQHSLEGKHFTLSKPGFVYDGIAIATPGFGREEVRKRMEKESPGVKPDISKGEEGERWYYGAEMWNCTFIFDEQGLVKSYEFYFAT